MILTNIKVDDMIYFSNENGNSGFRNSTLEILEVKKRELKTLLTKSNHLSRKRIKAFQTFLECFFIKEVTK